jgi:hypothetical protein
MSYCCSETSYVNRNISDCCNETSYTNRNVSYCCNETLSKRKTTVSSPSGKVSTSFLFLSESRFLVNLLQVVRRASSDRERNYPGWCLTMLRAFISRNTGKWILPLFQESRQQWKETNDIFKGSFLFTLTYMVSVSILKCSSISIKRTLFLLFFCPFFSYALSLHFCSCKIFLPKSKHRKLY